MHRGSKPGRTDLAKGALAWPSRAARVDFDGEGRGPSRGPRAFSGTALTRLASAGSDRLRSMTAHAAQGGAARAALLPRARAVVARHGRRLRRPAADRLRPPSRRLGHHAGAAGRLPAGHRCSARSSAPPPTAGRGAPARSSPTSSARRRFIGIALVGVDRGDGRAGAARRAGRRAVPAGDPRRPASLVDARARARGDVAVRGDPRGGHDARPRAGRAGAARSSTPRRSC